MAQGNRKLWSVSPSSVDTFQKCKRLWFRQYFLGDRGPTPAFLARGTSIHAGILDHWLAKGEMIIEHENSDAPGVKHHVLEFTQAAIAHLPKPMTDEYWIERRKEDQTVGLLIEQAGFLGTWSDPDGKSGPEWRQYIDLVECHKSHAIITDIKTSSDPGRYGKTPDELAHNVQLVANAKWVFSESDYKEITLRHLYLGTKTKRPKAFPVEVVVSREHVEREWQKILGIVREMVAWAELSPKDPNVLPPTVEHCSSYGGCRFKVDCFGNTADLVQITRSNMKEGERMSLLQDMMKRAGAAAKPVSGTVSTALVAPATTTVKAEPVVAKPVAAPITVIQSPAKPMSLIEKLAAAKKPPTVIENPVVVPAAQVLTPEVAQAAAVAAGYPAEPPAGYDPNGIVPPDAPSRTSTAEEVAAANAGNETKPVEEVKADAAEVSEATVEAVATDAPAKRKRRTKAEMEQARAAEAAGQAPAPSEPVQVGNSATTTQAIPQSIETTNTTGQRFIEGTAEAIAHPERAVPSELTTAIKNFSETLAKAATEHEAAVAHEEQEDDEVTKIRKILTTPDQAFGCGVEVLFIDCLPGKGWPCEQPEDLMNFSHAFNSLAADSAQKPDYRLIPYTSKGYLATAIKLYMKGLPKVIYVDSDAPGADVFLECVVPYVKLVYRGVR